MQKTLIIILLVSVIALAGVIVYQKLTPTETTPIVINQPIVNQPTVNQPAVNCVAEGKFGNPPEVCCYGLTKIEWLFACDGGAGVNCPSGCYAPDSNSTEQFICAQCGNGVCESKNGIGENQCNCSADCKALTTNSQINIISPASSYNWQENNSYNIQWTITDSLREKVQKVSSNPNNSDNFASLAVRTVGAEPCGQQGWCINGKVIPGGKVAEYSITTLSLNDFLSGKYTWKIPSNYSGYLIQPVYIQISLVYNDANGRHAEDVQSKSFTIIK